MFIEPTVLELTAQANKIMDNIHTPLTWVCRSNQVEVAKALIELGADVNQMDGYGYTPLTVACFHRAEETVRLLLDN